MAFENPLQAQGKILESLKEFSVVSKSSEGILIARTRKLVQHLFDPEELKGWKQKGIPQVKLTSDTNTILDN